jgi:hypothetical protein
MPPVPLAPLATVAARQTARQTELRPLAQLATEAARQTELGAG